MSKQQFWLFRFLTSLIFIYAGIKHLTTPGGIFKRIASSSIYGFIQNDALFMSAIYLSGELMVAAGLALLTGYKTKSAAWILLAMIIPITLTTQLENLNDLGPFFKNVAIMGSLLLITNRKSNKNEKNNIDINDHVNRASVLLSNENGTEERQSAVHASANRAYKPGT